MATRFVNIIDDDVEILIEREENENTRKKNEHCAEHLSANMKQVVHSTKSRKSAVYLVYSAVSRQLH